MGATADAYRRLIDRAAELGIASDEQLEAGRSADEVARRLTEAGLEPIESVVDWFATADGLRPAASGRPLFDGRDVLGLDAALADRAQGSAGEPGEPPIYRPGWLPIVGDPPILVVDTSTGAVLSVDLETQGATTLAPTLADWLAERADELGATTTAWAELRHNYFAAGATEVSRRDAHFLDRLADRLATDPPRRFRVVHAEIGSVVGNDGRERAQADLVIERLVAGGAPIDGIVEVVVAPAPTDAEGHVVRMYVPPR